MSGRHGGFSREAGGVTRGAWHDHGLTRAIGSQRYARDLGEGKEGVRPAKVRRQGERKEGHVRDTCGKAPELEAG